MTKKRSILFQECGQLHLLQNCLILAKPKYSFYNKAIAVLNKDNIRKEYNES